jgi:hypothetical protein
VRFPATFSGGTTGFSGKFAMKNPWGKFITTYDNLFWDWFDYCEIRVL